MKKKIILMMFLTLLMLTIGACGNNASNADDGELREVTFVLDWTPNTNHTGIYVALNQGFFQEEGLSVTIVQPPEDGAELLVATGRADFGVSFQDIMATILSGEHAIPITAVAAIIQHNTSGVMSLAGEGMDTPRGLEGRTYATWDWPIEQAIIRNVVEVDGGDFSLINMIPSMVTDEVSALHTGSVDAIWVFYAWAGVAAEVAGLEIDYFAFRDINPIFDYYTPVLITNDDLIESDPEVVRGFLRAVERGYKFAIEDPEAAAAILLEEVPELDEELVIASQRFLANEYMADTPRWGYIDRNRWNGFFAWLYENQLIEQEIPEGFGFTNEFLPSH